ncbi:TRAP transporter substrate-binding protein [Marinobacterium litorale]|uniref:TRAP transporter substrate-binding protein n=1 Tax=Marinobacterium litorale TaxID=404770 RepID=UPI0004272130|nr:TRAP transporter substrate-binding protein [Marinobacterium litorale]
MKKITRYLSTTLLALMLPVVSHAQTLRLGLITPPSHQWTKSAESFANEIKEHTDGRIQLSIYPSGQLGNEALMLQQMQRGALDMAFLAAGEIANRRPDFAALFAPYLVNSAQQASKLLQGETATSMLDELNSLGLVGLGYGMAGLRQIVMSSDVSSVEDLGGLKIRTMPVEPERDFWIKLGAAPTPLPLPELYDAFANGQVDGMQIDFEGTWNSRYLDQAGTVIHSSHMMLPMVAVMSARSWQKLSEDDRALLKNVVRKYLDDMIHTYGDIDKKYLAKIRESDVKVIEVDRSFFGDAIDQWYQEWRERAPVLEALEKEAASL